ncbi:hypothetical protein GALL_302240 [mine drainage metagenome]|uniref:Uncharacterized protein n=1 Tax=mine drainage metagenome TaxID=410659 RepID=A0A1J5RID9_9ZZZZ
MHDGQGGSGLLATLGVPHDLLEGGTNAADLVAIRRALESDWQALEAQADALALPVELEEKLARVLAHSGLLSLRRVGQGTLSTRMELLSASFAEAMLAPATEPLALLRGAVASRTPARLTLDDDPHLGLNRTLLRTYLASALGHHLAMSPVCSPCTVPTRAATARAGSTGRWRPTRCPPSG